MMSILEKVDLELVAYLNGQKYACEQIKGNLANDPDVDIQGLCDRIINKCGETMKQHLEQLRQEVTS